MRRLAIIAVIAGLLIAIWFGLGRPAYIKWGQNNASVDMMIVVSDIKKYVLANNDWPRSWEQLYPDPTTDRAHRALRSVVINWQATVNEITTLMERIEVKDRMSIDPPLPDLPFFVAHADNVPRDRNLMRSERYWNWAIARDIYMEMDLKRE